MAHVLSRLRNVEFDLIKKILKEHASIHAKEGLFLEKIWKNADDTNEVIFLFRTDDLSLAKKYIKKTHENALKENPNVNLPKMTFLED